MDIQFTKMHGLGNDFIIVEDDQVPSQVPLESLVKTICHRHFGVGADGFIVVAPADDPSCAIQFKYYNADGSRAEMCGNGIRCFTRYVHDKNIVPQNTFRVETLAGVVVPHIKANNMVAVDMGPPITDPAKIPFTGALQGPVLDYLLDVFDGNTVPMATIGMGNPHCLIFLNDLSVPLDPMTWGPIIEHHPLFPAKTNVEFCKLKNQHHIEVFVWERGVGPTLACGSGACAVAVAAILKKQAISPVTIELPGGHLQIDWPSPEAHVTMTGPAAYVFSGVYSFQPTPTMVTKT